MQMPTACVPKHYCGTHAPGWLSGSHPTRVGQVVNGKVCFHWGSNCCNWNAAIQIKKCNGFYVYKLSRTPVCWLRYCGNAGFGTSIVFINFFLVVLQDRDMQLCRDGSFCPLDDLRGYENRVHTAYSYSISALLFIRLLFSINLHYSHYYHFKYTYY